MNDDRANIYKDVKKLGYNLASYVSSKAFLWSNVEIGENCFVFEHNVVQPFVKLGNNIILWSGNHIGHHSKIEDNCFITSHVVVSGWCTIGKNSFIGVNATLPNNCKLGAYNWISQGATVNAETDQYSLVKPSSSTIKVLNKTALSRLLKIQSANRHN